VRGGTTKRFSPCDETFAQKPFATRLATQSDEAEAAQMNVAVQAQRLAVVVFALALAVAPIANPLLLALVLILGGTVAAYRGASDLVAIAREDEVVFRHFI
jgi:hypothetical protein